MCQFVPFSVEAQEPSASNISFQPNSIPEVDVYYDDHTFVFEYKAYFIRVAPFVIYNNKTYGMRAIIKFLKTKGWIEEGNYKWLVDKAISSIHYGFNLTRLPQVIADKVDYLGFRLVDLNFPPSWFELQEYPYSVEIDGELYNRTEVWIPKANIVFSFEDLYPYGYSVLHVNSTYVLIGNVKGETDLFVDPITFSSPTMTVTGGTEGSELGWWDLWNASDTNGWNVAQKHSVDNHYYFNCSIRIGASGSTTWFADTEKAVQIGNSTVGRWLIIGASANEDTHFRLGTDSGNPPRDGGHLHIYFPSGDRHWSAEIEFYGAVVKRSGGRFLYFGYYAGSSATIKYSTVRLYRTLCYRTHTWEHVNAPLTDIVIFGAPTISFDGVRVEGTAWGTYNLELDFSTTISISNFYGRDRTYLAFCDYPQFSGILNLINADVDSWSFYWESGCTGTVYRQYTFDTSFFFENNTYAEGTNVTISNAYLGTSDSWILSSNGSIPQQTYSYGHYNQTGGDTIYDYNPYNLTAVLDGYETYTTLLNITQQEDLKITLLESTATEETDDRFIIGIMYGVTGGFIFGILALITIVQKERNLHK